MDKAAKLYDKLLYKARGIKNARKLKRMNNSYAKDVGAAQILHQKGRTGAARKLLEQNRWKRTMIESHYKNMKGLAQV